MSAWHNGGLCCLLFYRLKAQSNDHLCVKYIYSLLTMTEVLQGYEICPDWAPILYVRVRSWNYRWFNFSDYRCGWITKMSVICDYESTYVNFSSLHVRPWTFNFLFSCSHCSLKAYLHRYITHHCIIDWSIYLHHISSDFIYILIYKSNKSW